MCQARLCLGIFCKGASVAHMGSIPLQTLQQAVCDVCDVHGCGIASLVHISPSLPGFCKSVAWGRAHCACVCARTQRSWGTPHHPCMRLA